MSNSKLKYFMQNALKKDDIIEVKGLPIFKDESGAVIPFQIKALSAREIDNIREKYRTRKIARDNKGKPLISGNELVYSSEYDAVSANDALIAEALVFPDLHDAELMKFYDCYDVNEMPKKLFKSADDYNYISKVVGESLGLLDKEDTEIIEELKNSCAPKAEQQTQN